MPIISKIKLPTNEYSPVLAFLIDCDAGDTTTWHYIETLSDFYQKFNTYDYSPSYEYAANLLSLGYRIITKNRNMNTNYKNVRIFKNLQYTYIDINKDYTSNMAIKENLNVNNLLSFDIVINSQLKDQDYVLLNNGYYNVLVWWNISNKPIKDVPVTSDNWFKLIDLKSLLISDFVNKLKGLAYKVESIDNKTIRIYNFADLSIIKNSSSNILIDYTNKNGSYDALAYYYDTIKLVDVVAKIPSNANDIQIKITFDGLKFSFFVYKYTINTIVFDEYFSDVNISNLLKKVSLQSTLVNVIVYTDQDTDLSNSLLGTFWLKREVESIGTFTPEYDELLDKFYFDIYIDLFQESLPDGNYLFFSKNKNSQNSNLVIFEDNDIVISNGNTLDITFGFLYLYIYNYSFLGTIDFKFSLKSYTNDNAGNDLINKIQFDNFSYYIDKCRFKNEEVSVIIIKFLLSNYLYRNLDHQMSKSDINFLLNTFYSYMNSDIVQSIVLMNYDNSVFGKLKLEIELQLTYKSIDLIENIKLDLLY